MTDRDVIVVMNADIERDYLRSIIVSTGALGLGRMGRGKIGNGVNGGVWGGKGWRFLWKRK